MSTRRDFLQRAAAITGAVAVGAETLNAQAPRAQSLRDIETITWDHILCADVSEIFLDGVSVSFVVAFNVREGFVDAYRTANGFPSRPLDIERRYGVVSYTLGPKKRRLS